ncbi:Holo-[acyl carrier protein] synthase [Candidatus Magnetoovum chiemensis]|nr:Holo-[acyl carrier protein] synthase [Candidatus Magnetoovum chiemensis]
MVFGLGIDIIKNSRIKDAILKWDDRFIKRIFTENETLYCKNKADSFICFAARFAVKEAFIKALGGLDNLLKPFSYKDIEVINNKNGKPCLEFHSTALMLITKQGITKHQISLSHERDYSVAVVVLEK